MRQSLTRIRAWTIPRLRRSIELRLPAYVGLISRPISSITARSWAYFDLPAYCCCAASNCAASIGSMPVETAGESVDLESSSIASEGGKLVVLNQLRSRSSTLLILRWFSQPHFFTVEKSKQTLSSRAFHMSQIYMYTYGHDKSSHFYFLVNTDRFTPASTAMEHAIRFAIRRLASGSRNSGHGRLWLQ